MQDLIVYTLDNQIYTPPKENKFKYIDGWQCMINSFIMSSYFPWVCLILILNRKNLKKPVILILIANWFFRAIGDILKASMDTRPREPDTVWPFSQKNWYISVELAHIFWFLGEIIGDWYPLVRTKIVTNDKKKMRWVYITCGLYNLVKVGAMFCGLLNFPIDLKQVDKNVWITDDIIQYNIVWWSIIAVMQIASCLYDLSVINALNSYLVDIINDFRTLKKNVFLEKFKRISEFRIILSMMASLVFFPFVTVFVIYLIIDYKNGRKFYSAETDAAIEQLRIAVLDFNYALMYMDQILLRFYVKRTQAISKITTNNLYKKNSISKNFSSSPTQYNYKKMNSLNDLNEFIIRQPSNIEKAKVASNTTYRTSLYSHDNTSSNNLNNQNSSYESTLIQNSTLINNENINYNNIIFNNNNNNNNYNNNNNNNNNNNFNNPYNDNIINYNNNNNYNNNQNIDISQINNFNNYPRRSLYYLNNLKINIIDENNH